MAYTILDTCILCGRCDKVCHSESIELGEEIYEIDNKTCDNCRGLVGGPQCVAVCPIECIIPLKSRLEKAKLSD